MSEDSKPFVPKSALQLQKMKLAKLMENPDKPVIIPESPKERKAHNAPEFVRNVMGSSAGAGSGEFHVYRHLRRKEYTRQKLIEEMSQKEQLDFAFLQKMEENRMKMEQKTAKNRKKRLKRKQRQQMKKKSQVKEEKSEDKSSEEEEEEEEESSDSDEEKSIPEEVTKEEKLSDSDSKNTPDQDAVAEAE